MYKRQHSHNVGVHDRCHTTVEPMIKQQWFVKMDEMIKPAVEGVKNGEIKLLPSKMCIRDRLMLILNWMQM